MIARQLEVLLIHISLGTVPDVQTYILLKLFDIRIEQGKVSIDTVGSRTDITEFSP